VKPAVLISLFLICQLTVLGQEYPCAQPSKKFIKNLNKCRFETNPQKKISALNKILNKFPEQPGIYFTIAEYYTVLGKESIRISPSPTEGEQILKKAIYFYQKTIQNCPAYDPKTYYNLGNLLLALGKEKEAITCFKEVIAYETKFPDLIKPTYVNQKNRANDIIEDLEFEKNLIKNPVPFTPKIVKNISSSLHEYFPMISPDNDLLFFTRKVDRTRLGDIAQNIVEEFTVSSKNYETSEFTIGDPLSHPFNDGTFNNYGSATLSVDNKEMIICACKKERVYKQNYLNCDLYSSTFKRRGTGGNDFQWSPLKNLGDNINTKDGWEAQPSLSSDGQMLFFTSIRKGSRDNDIYISYRQEDGSWSKAKAFDLINTAGKDKSPFFHQDGETLYFVSSSTEERKGMGGLDIFYIRKQDSSWSTPKNIGYPINSAQDELGIFVSTNGKIAYFSSFKDGDWNIYSFDLYEDARPEEVVILKGTVRNEDGTVATDARVHVHYEGSDTTQTIRVNEDDGSYATVVKVKQADNISVTVEKAESSFEISRINIKEMNKTLKKPVIITNMEVQEVTSGGKYILEDILYETDSYDLSKESKFTLQCFAIYLKRNPSYYIKIEGHTDDIGDDADNLVLSQNRAAGVKDYLIELGIDNSRLSSQGFGESEPKYSNSSTENRKRNRRTEFEITVQ